MPLPISPFMYSLPMNFGVGLLPTGDLHVDCCDPKSDISRLCDVICDTVLRFEANRVRIMPSVVPLRFSKIPKSLGSTY